MQPKTDVAHAGLGFAQNAPFVPRAFAPDGKGGGCSLETKTCKGKTLMVTARAIVFFINERLKDAIFVFINERLKDAIFVFINERLKDAIFVFINERLKDAIFVFINERLKDAIFVFINERLKDAIFVGVIPVLHTGNHSVPTPIFLPPASTDNASHVASDSHVCDADLAMQMNCLYAALRM